ncbi:hypothetical protein MTO96_014974 [Rhipicephalus appendiculatus]
MVQQTHIAIQARSPRCRDSLLLVLVRVAVEGDEPHEEQYGLGDFEPGEETHVVTGGEHRPDGVGEEQDELHDLHHGQVLLPPQELTEGRSERGEEVVGVHEDVHERVEAHDEHAVRLRAVRQRQPHVPRDDQVVNDVERAHLFVLLAEHEEHRVGQLGKLEHVEPPGEAHDLQVRRGDAQVQVLQEGVAQVPVGEFGEAHDEEGAEQSGQKVVGQDAELQVERLAVQHPAWAAHLDEVDVGYSDEGYGQGTSGKRPAFGPRVAAG